MTIKCLVKDCKYPAYFKLCTFHEAIHQKHRIGCVLEPGELSELKKIQRVKN